MLVIRILLLPVSILYGLLIQLRNLFYDLQIFKVNKFNRPVISVGNITAGGTGKTPFTIFLAKLLIGQGKKVAIVSRGYGRKSKGFLLVSGGNRHEGNSRIYGDEALLISKLVPDAVVAVCENRSTAVRQLISTNEIDLIIMDDGFQHRALHRDIDIVLLKDNNKLKNKMPIPGGLLREFRYNLKRADIIINRDSETIEQDHFACSFQINGLYDLDFKKWGEINVLKNEKCVAFAGIAHPENFCKNIKMNRISIKEFISYKDHYDFQFTDMQFLVGKCRESGCKYLLCTQKDLVKIRELPNLERILKSNEIKLLAPGINVSIDNYESFLKKIESHLD